MELYKIIEGIDCDIDRVDNVDIRHIRIDSREVEKGDLFVAMRGTKHDGNDYIDDALRRGAVAVVTEQRVNIPHIAVDNIRRAYALMSKNIMHSPSDDLKVIAVVGTCGKSTTAHFIYEILRYNGYKVGLIGTGVVRYEDMELYQDMTTPDPLDMHSYFRDMVDAGIEYVVMEVSAQAVYLDKMCGIKCEMGLFTNLSHDHLDDFGGMDIYKRVKISYFNSRYMKVGIVNSDDECARDIMARADMPIFTYGMDNPSDVFAIDLEYCVDGTRFVVNMLDEISRFMTELVGKYNVYNILGASLVARLIGVPMYGIRDAVNGIKAPSGRYDVIHTNRADFIVDYAHTPSALENVIKETRRVRDGNIYVVFGCGGNRDRSKRPIMGRIASELCDRVILTADNSRSETTSDIVKEIAAGIEGDVSIIEDRYDAIKYAYQEAEEGDVVLVVGKGSEKYEYPAEDGIYYTDREAILDIANN